MVNERDDKYDMQDEGEYHFSDEHVSYEADTETTKVADVAVAKGSALGGLSKSRRAAIALAVFFALMFVVYKMLSPAQTNLPIEAAGVSATPNQKTAAIAARNPVKPVVSPVANSAPASMPAMTQSQAEQPMQQQAMQQPQQQAITPPPAMSQQSMPIDQGNPGMPVTTQVASQQTPAAPFPGQQQVDMSSQPKEVQDKVATLEQQNAKLINQIQIEYPQKISDLESQNTALQAKLQEVNTRLATMEAALSQMTQLLQNSNNRQAARLSSRSAARADAVKQQYTVQAIIPGRAWLKTDVGDTVTVAEGDVLRDYGRVTKIDPYDGVVDIDTGNKVISLAYGTGGD